MHRLILLAVLFSSLVFSHTAAQESSEPTGQIAFIYLAKQGHVICTVTLDTGDEHCVPQIIGTDQSNPIWSPNGDLLAYQVDFNDQPPETHLYDMKQETVTVLPDAQFPYSWSPDGSRYVSMKRYDKYVNIVTVGLEDNNINRITNHEINDRYPAWSPDGKKIAYLSGYPNVTLTVVNADGSNEIQLTEGLNVNDIVQPQWSPDSGQIAFAVNGEFIDRTQKSEIYVVNADGSGLRQLTETGGETVNPRWSPDGQRLVFYGYAVGAFDDPGDPNSLRTEVFIINADGSGFANLTQSIGLDYHPSWSPDGEWIAFASTQQGPGIYIMRPDGTDVRMVTNEPPFSEGGRESNSPVWRPE